MSSTLSRLTVGGMIFLLFGGLWGCGEETTIQDPGTPPEDNIETLDASFDALVQDAEESDLKQRATRALDVRSNSSLTTALQDQIVADRESAARIIFLERFAAGSGTHAFIYFRVEDDSLHLRTNITPANVNPGSEVIETVALTPGLRDRLDALETNLPAQALDGDAVIHDEQFYLFGYGDNDQAQKNMVRGGVYPALGGSSLSLRDGSIVQAENIQRVLALWEDVAPTGPEVAETISTNDDTPDNELKQGLKWLCPCWTYSVVDDEVEFNNQNPNENFCECLREHDTGCNLVGRLISPSSSSDDTDEDFTLTKKQKGGGSYHHGNNELHWDPNWEPTVKTSASNKKVDPHVVLAHELAHAWHDVTDTRGSSHMDEERQATHAENQLREELGLPARSDYSGSAIDTTKRDSTIPQGPVLQECEQNNLRGGLSSSF